MEKACPVLSPEERRINEIIASADAALERDLWCLIRITQENVAKQMRDLPHEPPPEDYFAFGSLQNIFLRLCGADSATFDGGDAALAKRITENLVNLSRGWSASDATP